jgi:hypothetical protein
MSQSVITLTRAQALRDARYRRTQKQRLRTPDDIRAFIEDVGVCLLFPVKGIEMPNVYQAVCGAPKDTDTTLRDDNIGLTWNTKDAALDKRWWYYGKLIRGKATLVSLQMLPCLYALSPNFGGADDYLQEYEAGTLSADAKNIYEALLREGPLHAIELKRKVNLYGDNLKTKFDRAITELQTSLKILPVGVAEAGAWRYAFIYDLVARWLPNVPIHARDITRSDARSRLVTNYLTNAIFATPKAISSVFGWKAKETQVVIEKLANQGRIGFGRLVKGLSEDVIVMNLNDK